MYVLVIWRNLEYNIGNSFDATKGTFTCPHDGIYSFYATSGVNTNKYGSIFIYVNGSMKVEFHISTSNFAHSSPNGVFKLKKGDTVHIKMHGTFHYANKQCFRTYFQGHLVDLL